MHPRVTHATRQGRSALWGSPPHRILPPMRRVPISVAPRRPDSSGVAPLILACALVVSAAGCGKSTIREYESQACSTNDSDDPFLICSPAYDLVCINTYGVLVTNPKEAMKWDGGLRPVYVCRIACSTEQDCLQQGDV